jgi:antitoxin MazE
MKVQIGRWGNSLAVRLPKGLVERFQLREGEEFDLDDFASWLEAKQQGDIEKQREEALEEIRQTRWPLPPGYKFDREEANWRPAMDRW